MRTCSGPSPSPCSSLSSGVTHRLYGKCPKCLQFSRRDHSSMEASSNIAPFPILKASLTNRCSLCPCTQCSQGACPYKPCACLSRHQWPYIYGWSFPPSTPWSCPWGPPKCWLHCAPCLYYAHAGEPPYIQVEVSPSWLSTPPHAHPVARGEQWGRKTCDGDCSKGLPWRGWFAFLLLRTHPSPGTPLTIDR